MPSTVATAVQFPRTGNQVGFSETLKITRILLLKGAWRAKTDRRLDLLRASVVSEVGSPEARASC